MRQIWAAKQRTDARTACVTGLLLFLTGSLLGAAPEQSAARARDLEQLLNGVSGIHAPGIPGTVCAFGPQAFAVIAGKSGRASGIVVAASRLGKGRVMAFGHDGYLTGTPPDTADTGRLMLNAVRWLGGANARTPRVGAINAAGLTSFLQAHGLSVEAIAPGNEISSLGQSDVVCLNGVKLQNAAVRSALVDFVRQGGGLMTAVTGWGWLQLNPGKRLERDCGANLLLAPAGIAFAAAMTERTSQHGFAVPDEHSPYIHAATALDALLAQAEGKQKLNRQQVVQASQAVSEASLCVPLTDTIFRPRIESLLDGNAAPIMPTRKEPVRSSDGLQRVLLTMQINRDKELPPEKVSAHPAAADFPGSVSASAERVDTALTIDTSVPRWHSTGLYAAPGELVTVEIPDAAAAQGLACRIGAHKDGIWGRPDWWRCPEITRRFPLDAAATAAACAFGGLVYIDVPQDCRLGPVPVTIRDAVRAPLYVHGATSLNDWRKRIRHYPAPWAEVGSSKVVITVPAKEVRELDDPTSLMDFWDHVLDACADLAARPRERTSPERYVADRQISAGYMHAGYPIMTFLDAAPRFVDLARLRGKGDWGMFHEMGHNHQHRDWTFGGTGEVTVNLFSLFILDTCCPNAEKHGAATPEQTLSKAERHILRGADFERWKREPFTALAMYTQIRDAFGWEPFKKVFAEYRDLPDAERPRTDDDKRDQWLVRLSRTVGRSLGPFFEMWGVPTSAAARHAIASLPAWMPPGFPPKDPRTKKVAKDARIVRADSEHAGNEASYVLDGFPDTIWHTEWQGKAPGYPHDIEIDLTALMTIRGLKVLPRQGSANGWISAYRIEVSTDGSRWDTVLGNGAFEATADEKTIAFTTPVACRYIRFTATKGIEGQTFASMAELDVILAN